MEKKKNDCNISKKRFTFLLCATLCAIAFIFVYLIFVRNTTGQYLDQNLYNSSMLWQRKLANLTINPLLLMPQISTILLAIVLFFVVLVKRNISQGITVLAFFCATNISAQILKNVVLDRPQLIGSYFDSSEKTTSITINSLPSGHVTLATTAVYVIYLVSTKRYLGIISFFGIIFASLTGLATLLNHWHRPSDIMAAYLLVGFWLFIFLAFKPVEPQAKPEKSYNLWWPVTSLAATLATTVSFLLIIMNKPVLLQHKLIYNHNEMFYGHVGGMLAIFATILLLNSTILFADKITNNSKK